VQWLEIRFNIELDENRVPEKINMERTRWQCAGSGCKSNYVVDLGQQRNEKKKLCVLICGQDVPVDENEGFAHQTLVTMADTFRKTRATDDEKMSDTMKDFL